MSGLRKLSVENELSEGASKNPWDKKISLNKSTHQRINAIPALIFLVTFFIKKKSDNPIENYNLRY